MTPCNAFNVDLSLKLAVYGHKRGIHSYAISRACDALRTLHLSEKVDALNIAERFINDKATDEDLSVAKSLADNRWHTAWDIWHNACGKESIAKNAFSVNQMVAFANAAAALAVKSAVRADSYQANHSALLVAEYASLLTSIDLKRRKVKFLPMQSIKKLFFIY